MRKNSKIVPQTLEVTQSILDSFNVEQAKVENRARLMDLGGVEILCKSFGVNVDRGHTTERVEILRKLYGDNTFPDTPMSSFPSLLMDALSDTTLLVLLAAAAVSLGIGIADNPSVGWIEGTAIFIAVFLVANISAINDYTKELQFRALELSAQGDERASVLRDGVIERINPVQIVVGDILVIQVGDAVMADGILVSAGSVECNESSLTGESESVKKTRMGDCFVLSSCLVTGGDECRILVTGIGRHSQWGRIKQSLVTEAQQTPLQEKLEDMSTMIGYIGIVAAIGTFVALVISIWARNGGRHISYGIIHAFILAVTIVVVAIPEGLPLAVTIALAYSTKKMYRDQCFIRVLAACETMGNCTNICSDKTGTLTQNKMTCVEGWFGDTRLDSINFDKAAIPPRVKRLFIEHACVNRTAYLVYNEHSKQHHSSTVIGNKTEGVLIDLVQSWGFQYDSVKNGLFNEETDRVFPFNSWKKRSTAIIHRPDGSVRLFCKGAPEWLMPDCSFFSNARGEELPITPEKKQEFEDLVVGMANAALRTLLIAHRDFKSRNDLPANWESNPPDNSLLCIDCIIGVIDPLRPDVKDAIDFAHHAGVFVRMVTGDSTNTAIAIAKQCGILTADGITVEGPVFRNMSPKAVDDILPRLQVMARSSPDDKHLLVSRLNGRGIPRNQEEWEKKHGASGLKWETDRDRKLPGYVAEWEVLRPDGGEVVGVTGDGTNDAPALKEADVGLAMGITGTKVAQNASDIIILDDRFSSIVRAIIWGRSVYDNIRKFLQFQLTVNIVALVLVFVGAVGGFPDPLNAVQMLWVNLIMDTLGALALGTEAPSNFLLNRKPYKRHAPLINRPMWRNIICQAIFQLVVLLVLLFRGSELLNVNPSSYCVDYSAKVKDAAWNLETGLRLDAVPMFNSTLSYVTCTGMDVYCRGDMNTGCFESWHQYSNNATLMFKLSDLKGYSSECLVCNQIDATMGTVIFNTFIFCQFFNEYSSRLLNDDWNMFAELHGNYMFLVVSALTFGIQVFLVSLGGKFVETTPISIKLWIITVGIGALTIPVGILMRLIPVAEDPSTFYFNPFLEQQLVDARPMTQTIAHYLSSSASYLEQDGERGGNIRRQRSDTMSFFGGGPVTPDKTWNSGGGHEFSIVQHHHHETTPPGSHSHTHSHTHSHSHINVNKKAISALEAAD